MSDFLDAWIERSSVRAIMDGFVALMEALQQGARGLPVPVLIGAPRSGKTTMILRFLAERRGLIHRHDERPGHCWPVDAFALPPKPTPRNIEAAWHGLHHYRNDRLGEGPIFRRPHLVFVDDCDNLANATPRNREAVLAVLKQITTHQNKIFVLVGTARLEAVLAKLPQSAARFRIIRFDHAVSGQSEPDELARLVKRRPRLRKP